MPIESSVTPAMVTPPLMPVAGVKKTFNSTLGGTSALLRAANPLNRGIVIWNRGVVTIYFSCVGSPATTDDIPIKAGDTFEWPRGMTQAIYVIAPGLLGTTDVSYFEFL